MPKPKREPLAPKATTAKGWSKAETLSPLLTERMPGQLSDGAVLPFDTEILTAPLVPLDPEDPAVKVLIHQIDFSANGPQIRLPWHGDDRTLEELTKNLAGWRLLAGTEDRRVFGKGVPPTLVTVGVKRERRGRWELQGVSPARQLRAARDGIRASSFRVDPDTPLSPEQTTLRLLVVEQTRAGGRLAHGRFLAPDLYLGEDEVMLRCFITPLEGWQTGTRRWETPLLVRLPEPLGHRTVVDGAIFFEGTAKPAR